MGFGLPNEGGGDFLPLLSFNAKDGRFSTSEKVEQNGQFVSNKQVIMQPNPAFLMDFSTAVKGWLLFATGTAPVKVTVPADDPMPPAPPRPATGWPLDQYGKEMAPRGGFVLHCMGGDKVLREFSSNSLAVIDGVGAAMDAWRASPEREQGMVPVVQLTNIKQVGKHKNYQPELKIIKWVPRPAELGDGPTPTYTPPAAKPPVAGFGMNTAPAGGAPLPPVSKAAEGLEDSIPFNAEWR
jgi:hypothetical protein